MVEFLDESRRKDSCCTVYADCMLYKLLPSVYLISSIYEQQHMRNQKTTSRAK